MKNPGAETQSVRFLMCRPEYFGVDYVINPWMKGNVGRTDREVAAMQWERLYEALKSVAEVELIEPQPGLPDMVFTANAGILIENEFVLTHFAKREREPEEPQFKKWFKERGVSVHLIPPNLLFEGAGDALLDGSGRWLWVAYGDRTSLETHPYLAKIFNIEVLSLRLTDPRFYHLDTCFMPMEDGYLMYYPGALDANSNRIVEERVPPDKRIELGMDEAVDFSANSVNIGKKVIMNRCSSGLRKRLSECGFEPIETPLTEFMKAGGSAKCLTLRLNEKTSVKRTAHSTVATRKVKMEGQLIDSHLMSRVCDSIIYGGGAFQLHEMRLGRKRNELSTAEIEVSAPSEQALDKIIRKIIPLGATPPQGESADALLAAVGKNGVAPENFYSTTIYHTEIRVDGEWVSVENLRMDGVVAVSGKTARCKLFRELEKGDKVVTGGEGIRIVRPVSEYSRQETFSFMGANISSERRAELTIERIAWEVNRIKNLNGRLVVVAGPVVVHTGGSAHLAQMVRDGYISALLGGNGTAAHDIELAMLGTSLGIDLRTGRSVEGGHRNHLVAINRIRRAGSIAKAVENGELKSGLFYELVKNNIPFCLAGSIRDDGPLPDTEMDLTKAQAEYSRLIKGADMILMLSSMLHAIGTGNMTPANVRLVCVDINPAVVTKLTDRGSLESVGIVTDVGLFLSQLVKELKIFSN